MNFVETQMGTIALEEVGQIKSLEAATEINCNPIRTLKSAKR